MGPGRPYDVAVFGATGFLGGLVAGYLARRYAGAGLRFAIAGRSKEKLAARREALVALDAACREVGVVEARAEDTGSLAALSEQANVVVNAVSPYARWGEPVVAACVETRTDCVDVSAESGWAAPVVDRWHKSARERGVRIVNGCGFEGVLHDLGTWLTVRALPDDEPIRLEAFVRAPRALAGGAWRAALGDERRREPRPGVPRRTAGGRTVGLLPRRLRREPSLDAWALPFPIPDPEIVLRSAGALPEYGPDFWYGPYARVERLPVALGAQLALAALAGFARWDRSREWLRRMRERGRAADEARRGDRRVDVRFCGAAQTAHAVTEVRGGDPDEASATAAAEAALCLAHERGKLPPPAGVLTPAVALGGVFVDRLRAAGIAFERVER